MNIEDLPSNSRRSKEQEAPASDERPIKEKVISGKAKVAKKGGVGKMADLLCLQDIREVGEYVFKDVFIPNVKKVFKEVVDNTIDALFYGKVEKPSGGTNASRVNYNAAYRTYNEPPVRSATARPGYVFENVTLETRSDAEEVLASLKDIIDRYGICSVADLYDITGMDSKPTDSNYGWSDLERATIVRTVDGYLLKLPKPSPFNR